jgi:RNA polymerase sigma-70 factor (ECF subfamily)
MSECKDLFALLSEYLDLELPPQSCAELERHLADCPPCIEFVNSLRRSIDLCRGYEPAERPAPLDQEARARLLAAFQKNGRR